MDPLETGCLFADRVHAGRVLARALAPRMRDQDVLVLGLPRGGVPVAAEVAERLHAPLDVWVVRKLGVPGAEELAMGAISAGGVVEIDPVLSAQLRLPEGALRGVIERESEELERRESAYRRGCPPPTVRGRTAILVDDGLATGATMHAAVTALRALAPKCIVVAAPVAAQEACEELGCYADACICLAQPEPFFAVGRWYARFEQTQDEEVVACLERVAGRRPSASESAVRSASGCST